MKTQTFIIIACMAFLPFYQTNAFSVEHDRYVRLTLDESQITAIQSGALDAVELSTEFSDTFKPAQLQNTDMLNVHVEFVDQDNKKVYVVVRDLGGEYLNLKGWQWFQAAISLDKGTVSGTYVNGWVFTDSIPRLEGNFACCTRTAVSNTTIESAGYGFDVTNSSFAIGGMRIQFNFNNASNPVVITDGGGFDRLSLKIRSEDIAIIRLPQTSNVMGPLDDDGAPIDIDGDGNFGDYRKVGIDSGLSQHFRGPLKTSVELR